MSKQASAVLHIASTSCWQGLDVAGGDDRSSDIFRCGLGRAGFGVNRAAGRV